MGRIQKNCRVSFGEISSHFSPLCHMLGFRLGQSAPCVKSKCILHVTPQNMSLLDLLPLACTIGLKQAHLDYKMRGWERSQNPIAFKCHGTWTWKKRFWIRNNEARAFQGLSSLSSNPGKDGEGWAKLALVDHLPQPGLSCVFLASWVTPPCFYSLIPTLCLFSFRAAPWVRR